MPRLSPFPGHVTCCALTKSHVVAIDSALCLNTVSDDPSIATIHRCEKLFSPHVSSRVQEQPYELRLLSVASSRLEPMTQMCNLKPFLCLGTFESSTSPVAGVGTIIAALAVCSLETLLVGVLQMVTAAIIVGWVWSILWGWELYQTSKRKVALPGVV